MAEHTFALVRGPAGAKSFILASVCITLAWAAFRTLPSRRAAEHTIGSSPVGSRRDTEVTALPYPPDVLPGSRDVSTPYGSIHVFEFGPEDGPRVLFVHGISTPAIALGDLALELAEKGYRVMIFDLFGRGYSEAPVDLPYDARLYASQILMVLASSKVNWTASPGFHLVGYSLGGCLSVSFARHFPHLLQSLSVIAGSGLIRSYHVGWKSKLLYTSGLLPEWLVRYLVRRRIRPQAEPPRMAGGTDIIAAETKLNSGDSDANGGAGFDSAAISKHRPGVTVSEVVRWQIDHHKGFIGAFMSTIRNAPIYAPQPDWSVLSEILAARRAARDNRNIKGEVSTELRGLQQGKILSVLATDDSVIVAAEHMKDVKQVLGDDGVEFAVLKGGHELPITDSTEVARVLQTFWLEP